MICDDIWWYTIFHMTVGNQNTIKIYKDHKANTDARKWVWFWALHVYLFYSLLAPVLPQGSCILPMTHPCAWLILVSLTRRRHSAGGPWWHWWHWWHDLVRMLRKEATEVQPWRHCPSFWTHFELSDFFPSKIVRWFFGDFPKAFQGICHQISHIKSRFSDGSMNEIPPMDSFASWHRWSETHTGETCWDRAKIWDFQHKKSPPGLVHYHPAAPAAPHQQLTSCRWHIVDILNKQGLEMAWNS